MKKVIILLAFLLVYATVVYANLSLDTVKDYANTEVHPTLLQGGPAAINWVTALLSPFGLALSLYLGIALVKELRDKVKENREGWLLLRDSREALYIFNAAREEQRLEYEEFKKLKELQSLEHRELINEINKCINILKEVSNGS